MAANTFLVRARILLARMHTVNQPNVSPKRLQSGAARHRKPCLTGAFRVGCSGKRGCFGLGNEVSLRRGRRTSCPKIRLADSAAAVDQTLLFQKPVQHRAQRHWIDWLVEQMVAAVLCLMQQRGADVAADEKRRDRGTKCGAQLFDRFYAGALVG